MKMDENQSPAMQRYSALPPVSSMILMMVIICGCTSQSRQDNQESFPSPSAAATSRLHEKVVKTTALAEVKDFVSSNNHLTIEMVALRFGESLGRIDNPHGYLYQGDRVDIYYIYETDAEAADPFSEKPEKPGKSGVAEITAIYYFSPENTNLKVIYKKGESEPPRQTQ